MLGFGRLFVEKEILTACTRVYNADDDDDNFKPGDIKSIGDCLVLNTIFLPNVTPFI